MNVVSVLGGKVHSMTPGAPGRQAFPLCRTGSMTNSGTKYRRTDAPLTCKTCVTYAERREAFDTLPAEPATISAEVNNNEEDKIMAAKTETAQDTTGATVEQVNANIERARSLAEAENVEALAELNKETEALISSLPSRGKTPNGDSWTKAKKELRDGFKAAATVQEKPAPKAEVATVEAAPVATYDQYEGVPELVDMGAEKVAEGVRLHIKTSHTAKEIASVILDMWRRMPNKNGNPDIIGDSDQAKKASGALKKKAGEALGRAGLDAFEVKTAVERLWRSVQTQRADVRAEYLRDLDSDSEEAQAEREHFAGILKDKPEDVPASKWVADHYGVALKGPTEIAREAYHEKQALEGGGQADTSAEGGEGDGEGEGESAPAQTPDEHVQYVVKRILKDIHIAKPDDFEKASDEVKASTREQLEEAQKAIRAMLAAVL